MKPTWVLVPELMPDTALQFDPKRILRYPGIKEDVYAPSFRPDPAIRLELGLSGDEVVVVLRPPAQQAHYHVAESDELFRGVMEFLGTSQSNLKVILLPRNQQQGASIRKQWPELFRSGRVMTPERAVDGLNLIWHSDLVISGGGTMNREAAALGVPVYSIFRGEIGAVDHYLSKSGRLVLMESVDEIPRTIRLERRTRAARTLSAGSPALTTIVDRVLEIAEDRCRALQHSVQL